MSNRIRSSFLVVAEIITAVMICTLMLYGSAPEGWTLAGSKPANYDTGVDEQVMYNRHFSVYLKFKGGEDTEGFGTLMQSFNANKYLGKRVRFSGTVKSEGVEQWAGLWMRVDKGAQSVAFDNMGNRPIKGTTGWQDYEVVLDVPKDATGIAFGILLGGSGTVWLSNVKFEEVGTEVPTTSISRQQQPTNLDFQATGSSGLHGSAPEGWFIAGSKPKNYDTGVDEQVMYNRHFSVYLKFKGGQDTQDTEGFGTLMQSFNANKYLGKRVRFSGTVKSEGVEWAGLWMRVDKGDRRVAFDNMGNRPIRGTTGWQDYEVVLDVPKDATGVAFGILLDGSGTVWLSNVKFEEVGTEVPTTDPKPTVQAKPTNLGFER